MAQAINKRAGMNLFMFLRLGRKNIKKNNGRTVDRTALPRTLLFDDFFGDGSVWRVRLEDVCAGRNALRVIIGVLSRIVPMPDLLPVDVV